MAKKERFKLVYSQGSLDVLQILVDTETGSALPAAPLAVR